MPVVDSSDDDMFDGETFINNDAIQQFTDYLSGMSMHSERGFISDIQD